MYGNWKGWGWCIKSFLIDLCMPLKPPHRYNHKFNATMRRSSTLMPPRKNKKKTLGKRKTRAESVHPVLEKFHDEVGLKHLADKGYQVVEGVMSEEKCKALEAEVWTLLEAQGLGLDRNNPSTWTMNVGT